MGVGVSQNIKPVVLPKSKLILWIRTWNPSWFVNPFYSPSIAGYVWGTKMLKDLISATEYAISFFSALGSIRDAADKKKEDAE
jgi:hypothetical protein